ncbi:MAG: hypothetical protein H7338_05125 [Candidatus Sericytochromatia bacterium]|nr:hypothetical protein [Candidatus Sericytochromatia bacterium]
MSTTEAASLIPALQAHCRDIRLPRVSRQCAALAEQARRSSMDPLAYLHGLL